MRITGINGRHILALAALVVAWLGVPLADVSAITITDDFSYADASAFESVYTLSNTSGGSWNASFDGDKMTVSNSSVATGAFDSYYARRPIGNVTGNFVASLDLTWSSPNEPGERARIALHLLKGDGTGAHETSLPQMESWTFENDVASAGMWNDYGINAVTLLIDGMDDPEISDVQDQFPWRPAPGIGTSGAATVSIERVGTELTLTYDDGNVVRSLSMQNTDTFTHVGIWYSHFTGFPGQFDGSATYTVDNLLVDVPEPTVPGDFDGDGDVDGADFVVWQTNFPTESGATLATGDADGDGDVDGADFVIWQTNFPFTPSPSTTTVPEPASLLLAVTASFIALRSRRRWRQ